MLTALDLIIIVIYLISIVIIGISFHKQARTSVDSYFLGNRKLPWWALGASGMASNTDIAGTMVIAALIFSLGAKGVFVELRGGMVLVMAFFAVFMGKWTRRSQVLTIAEWMKFRFGSGVQGKSAQLVSAVSNLIVSIWIIGFFSLGGGKFIAEVFDINVQLASVGLILFALTYTALSGFAGVIWTDVFQAGLVLLGIISVVTIALSLDGIPQAFQLNHAALVEKISLESWSSLKIPHRLGLGGQWDTIDLFSLTVGFYFLKTFIEGMAGAGGYMSQRFFAAKSDKDAAKLSLFWIFLLSFRWPLVGAFALFGLHYHANVTQLSDPELILPISLEHYIPSGLRGLILASFVAAAMSTFDSVINSSAAYWVKDIYQRFICPGASETQLIRQSRLASIVIVILGVVSTASFLNVNQIWSFLTMAMGAGIFIPLALRWYWSRFNGWGFVAGTVCGMVASVVVGLSSTQYSEILRFLIPAAISFAASIFVTLITPPVDQRSLSNFYRKTRPFGLWRSLFNSLPTKEKVALRAEHKRDILGLIFAVPWQISLACLGLSVVLQNNYEASICFFAFITLSVLLWHFWYKRLDEGYNILKEIEPTNELGNTDKRNVSNTSL